MLDLDLFHSDGGFSDFLGSWDAYWWGRAWAEGCKLNPLLPSNRLTESWGSGVTLFTMAFVSRCVAFVTGGVIGEVTPKLSVMDGISLDQWFNTTIACYMLGLYY